MSVPASFVPTHYTLEFGTNFRHKAQQLESKLKGYVTMESFSGESKSFNFMDETGEPDEITVRAGETRISDATSEIRWIYTRAYDRAYLLDKYDDKLAAGVASPQSTVMASMMKAVERRVDDRIVAAAIDAVTTGKNRDGSATFDTTNQRVAIGYNETGSPVDCNLTIQKLRKVRSIFGINEVAGQGLNGGEQICMAITQYQLDSLLRETAVISADYAAVKALVHGEVDSFMGIKFIIMNRLPFSNSPTNTYRRCLAWVKSGIAFSMGGWETHMDIRADRSHALQVRWEGRMGGIRTEEKKVLDVLCLDS